MKNKGSKSKKVFVFLLVVAITISSLPMSAIAAGTDEMPDFSATAETQADNDAYADGENFVVPVEQEKKETTSSKAKIVPEESPKKEAAETEKTSDKIPLKKVLSVSAALQTEAAVDTSGTCGSNLTWILYDNGELVISGEGAMESYDSGSVPWYSARSRIQSVTIGESVTSIGDYAFYNCTGLTSVTIPNSVTSIGGCAFWLCTGLTEITIPDSVVSIGIQAFGDCTGLTSVTIGSGVTSIGNYAFYNCTGLTQINYNAKAVDNLNYYNNVFGNAGTSGSGINVVFGDSVEKIPAYLFYVYDDSSYSPKITSVTIPDSVTSIGNDAFSGCTGLTDVYYGSTVPAWKMISIGFNNTPLTSATIHYAEPTGRIAASGECGADGNNLTWTLNDKGELVISGEGAMASYSSGSAPWYSRGFGIVSVSISDGVTSIGDWAFYNCTGLTQINYNAKAANDLTCSSYVFYNAGTSGSGINVVFGDSVEKIPAYLFYVSDDSRYSPKIASVTIGGGVTSIGGCAFYNCTGLTSVTIPNSVTSIGGSAFWGCTGLTSVTIPDSVTSIGFYAFYGCAGLKDIYYGSTAPAWKMISQNSGVSSSATIHYAEPTGRIAASGECGADGNNLTWTLNDKGELVISGEGAMASYSSGSAPWYPAASTIQSVTIGENVTSIGNYAFWLCTGLTSVTIGSGVTSIGNYAFYNCTGLTDVYYGSTVPAWKMLSPSIGSNNTSLTSATIHYAEPTGRIAASGECGADGDNLTWTLNDKGELVISGEGAMASYSSGSAPWYPAASTIQSVTIGENVTSIGNYAFFYCTGLTQINYNAKAANDLISDSNVFYNAGKSGSGITVTFGNKVKKVPAYLFAASYSSDKPKINEICFTGSAPIFGSYAFRYLTSWAYYPYGNTTWTSSVRQNYGGTITWSAYSNAEIIDCESSISKNSYILGEALDTSGISMKLTHIDGCVETFEYATGKLSLGSYDMTKPGWQTIEVTCKGKTASFDIYIHDMKEKEQDKSGYPESMHPYEDNFDYTYIYTVPNAHSLKVTFSESTAVERNVDYIYVNGTGYTGTALAGQMLLISGDTLNIRLTSDSSDSDYGFSIESIVAIYAVNEYGDLNGDTLINKKDSLLMKMYLADNSTVINQDAADVFADGAINKKDSLLLKQFLAGLDVVLGA